ncbi:iron-sulfur cluster biosynthesis family protein [Wolffia australiana]
MSSLRNLLCKIAPYLNGKSFAQPNLLGSSALYRSFSSSVSHEEELHMTESCIRRMKELTAKQESNLGKMLRLSVETGGCSGFQYVFGLENKQNDDDRVFEKDGVKLIVDNISYDFVKGATVDYTEELIRSAFVVSTNPSAVAACSCFVISAFLKGRENQRRYRRD